VDDRGVRSSLDERRQWSEAHPWWTGCYFGAMTGLLLGLITGAQFGLRTGLYAGLSIPPWAAPMMALAIQHRWLQRPSAGAAPIPRLGRPWSRTSDRALVWIRVVAVAGFAVTAVDSVTGDDGRAWAAVRLVSFGFVAVTTLGERRSRSLSSG
jgi:hypothetical protein